VYTLHVWCSILRIDNLTGKQQAGKQEVIKLLPDLFRIALYRCLNCEDVSKDYKSRRFLEMDFASAPLKGRHYWEITENT
jgi:hypothetical protein